MIPSELRDFAQNFKQQSGLLEFEFAIILGSGFASVVEYFEKVHSVPYSEIPGFSKSRVKGHSGRFSVCRYGQHTGLIFEGRLHYYEGLPMRKVVAPVMLAYLLGVKKLLITNASGGVNPSFRVGDIMLVEDHINLMGDCPLRGENNDNLGPRFTDMSAAYSKKLNQLLRSIAKEKGIHLHSGVYAGVHGPAFETPAEYRYIRIIGADAVGMSTVPEVIMARYLGMEVCCLSVITDLGIEGQVEEVSHDMVLEAARKSSDKVAALYGELIEKMQQEPVRA